MDISGLRPRWNNIQLLWFGTWIGSMVASLFVYNKELGALFSPHPQLCGLPGLGSTLYDFISPKNWLALYSIALTVVGVIWLLRLLADKRPEIGHYKTVAGAILLLVLVAAFAGGC